MLRTHLIVATVALGKCHSLRVVVGSETEQINVEDGEAPSTRCGAGDGEEGLILDRNSSDFTEHTAAAVGDAWIRRLCAGQTKIAVSKPRKSLTGAISAFMQMEMENAEK